MAPDARIGEPLRLFSSWSRKLETLQPIDSSVVRIYSCGPTVYNFAHIGNLRAYLFTDLLRRTINWKGWAVNHVINITDVGHLTSDQDTGEDKVELAASQREQSIWSIAEYYTKAFKEDLRQLNVLRPSIWSTATDHIEDMIEFATRLERHGVTYELDSGLYFDTSCVPDYGVLAGMTLETRADARAEGARVETIANKRNPTDFAIWRKSLEPGKRQMEWSSPWGPGAPGWHLECSVMSMKYLSTVFDIHTGGIDHREIHHCNEIAQNQAFTQSAHPGANLWMHNNFLVDRNAKMSKSRGEFTTLRTLIDAGVHPLAFRLMCLSANYRVALEFTPASLLASLKRLTRLVRTVTALRAQLPQSDWMQPGRELAYSRGASFRYQRKMMEEKLSAGGYKLLAAFDCALSADLMTPQCLPVLDQALRDAQLSPEEKLRVVANMDLVLGLRLMDLSVAELNLRPASATLTTEQVSALVKERERARQARNFAKADEIRRTLAAEGVALMDSEASGTWEWVPRLQDH